MSSIPQTFYVYVLARPDGQPFYVGKGTGWRVNAHEAEARSGHRCHKCFVIRKIWRSGGQVQRYLMLETTNEREALDYEIELIALYGQSTLTNKTSGGDGLHDISEDTRMRISRAQRVRASRPGERERLRAMARALWDKPGYREKKSVERKAFRFTPAMIEDLKVAQQVAQNKPTARANHSASSKAMWTSPDYRAKRLANMGKAESHYRAKLTWDQVRDIRARWATGNVTQRTLAREYEIGLTTVGHIVYGRSWKDDPGE